MDNKKKRQLRERRHRRVRAKIIGTSEIPRVSIFKSNKHLFVQFIDDAQRKTILSSKIVSGKKSKIKGTKSEKAAAIGDLLAEKAKESGIKKAVFDRGGFKYHGRIKALADSLRKSGIKF